jgi:hypothetical protein
MAAAAEIRASNIKLRGDISASGTSVQSRRYPGRRYLASVFYYLYAIVQTQVPLRNKVRRPSRWHWKAGSGSRSGKNHFLLSAYPEFFYDPI